MKLDKLIFLTRFDKYHIDDYLNFSFKDDFYKFCEITKTNCRKEDYDIANSIIKNYSKNANLREIILTLFKDYFNYKITGNPSSIKINKEHFLEWIDVRNKIDEDFLICCFISEDKNQYNNYSQFTWKRVLQPDDSELDELLKNGVHDNHLHLKGSADIFNLNLVRIANHNNLEKYFQDNKKILNKEICDKLLEFSLLRLMLFNSIIDPKYKINKDFSRNNIVNRIREEKAKINNYMIVKKKVNRDYKIIDYSYLLLNSFKSKDYNYKNFGKDKKTINPCYGERVLIYNAFKNYNKNVQELLPIYITMKNYIKAFFIQNNDINGFSNFGVFDSRKDLFIEPKLKNEIFKSAYDLTKETSQLKNDEFRIAPKGTRSKNYKQLKDINDTLKFIVNKNTPDYTFVYHFIKSSDKMINKIDLSQAGICRNSKTRKKVTSCVNAIKSMYRNSIYIEKFVNKKERVIPKIKGFDAANTEYRCRPEVFAEGIKEIKKYIETNYNDFNIGITYHVGEDFSDIVDGLRAIDEAIEYLELSSNNVENKTKCNRLGHCIALGIDPNIYYRSHKYSYKTKQDQLDDLVWLYKKMKEYGITTLLKDYRKNAMELFEEIYFNNDLIINKMDKNNAFDLYCDSMKLRGENPEIYLNNIPKDCSIQRMYYLYHYNIISRKIGDEPIVVENGNDYVEIVTKVQTEYRNRFATKGISIETNPSSNYLIGPIENLDELPLFNFDRTFLENSYINCNITINTDDQGIFNTCLYNEYAIVYNCLKNMKIDGFQKYTNEQIKEFIEHLAENSRNVTF